MNKQIELRGRTLDVEYKFEYDHGVDRYSNGDPGYPPSWYKEIISIELDGVDYCPVLDRHYDFCKGKANLYNEIYELLFDE